MNSSEAKKWILGILIIVIACGGYFYYTNRQSAEVPTPSQQQVTEQQKTTTNEKSTSSDTAFGITNKQIGEHVTVQGPIVDVSGGKGNLFPVIKDTTNDKTIKGALFSPESSQKYNKEQTLEQLQQERKQQKELIENARSSGQSLTFEGKVDEYKGELELIISKVY